MGQQFNGIKWHIINQLSKINRPLSLLGLLAKIKNKLGNFSKILCSSNIKVLEYLKKIIYLLFQKLPFLGRLCTV